MSNAATLDLQNSTIVRFNKSTTYRALASAFGFAERHAPGLGAYVAERLWFRIPADGRARRPKWLPAGKRFEVSVHGRRVTGENWTSRRGGGEPGPIVYLMHGWGGRQEQLAMFVPLLLESGYSVISFDALGHGRSDAGPMGRGQGSILDFVESLKAVIAAAGPAHAVIAHSLGSTAVARALREGVRAERLVFVAPMADPRRYLQGFVQLLGAGEQIRARLQQRIERRVGVEMQALAVPEVGQRAVPPLLIFHDRDDREVNWSDGADIAWAWPQARLVTTSRLGHRRILSSPAVVREAVRLIGEGKVAAMPLKRNRSGARQGAFARPPRWAVGGAMHFALIFALVGFAGLLHAAEENRPHRSAQEQVTAVPAPVRADAAALRIEPPDETMLRREELQHAREQREYLRELAPMQLGPSAM